MRILRRILTRVSQVGDRREMTIRGRRRQRVLVGKTKSLLKRTRMSNLFKGIQRKTEREAILKTAMLMT